eukprot:TRINITY_DN9265_c1_g1_i1.p1 TRINITY_DN9265_c1_g1~~TRINITY_DN9265_c1_g1_i1.p1  ORF type:complete len:872 (+),score=211.97 TRINITY_DN9265_c1_g1_i1:167-2782(+)
MDETLYEKLMEVGLMSQSTAKRLMAMKQSIAQAKEELNEHDRVIVKYAAEECEWTHEVQERNEEMIHFQSEVMAFGRMKREWEEQRAVLEDERRTADERRAAREEDCARFVEEKRKIEVDRHQQRYTTFEKRLQAVLQQRERQKQQRVDYAQRLQLVSNKRETSWDSLNTASHLRHTERLTELAIKLDEEMTDVLQHAGVASQEDLDAEVAALRSKANLLEDKVRTLQVASSRKEVIVNTRKELQDSDVDVVMNKCDEMLQRAEEAKLSLSKQDDGASIASDSTATEVPNPHSIRALQPPVQPPYLAISYTPASRPSIANNTVLPPITVTLFEAETLTESDTTLTICPTSPLVTLTGQLTSKIPYRQTSALFSEVVVSTSPDTCVQLCVTALLPSLCVVATFEVYIQRNDAAVVVTKHDVNFTGTKPHHAYLGNERFVVPPSGVIPRIGEVVRCLDPLFMTPLHEGVESNGGGLVWEQALMCDFGSELLGAPRLHHIKIDSKRGLIGCNEEGITTVRTGETYLQFLVVVMFAVKGDRLAAYGIKDTTPHLALIDLRTRDTTQVPLPSDITVTYLDITENGNVVVGSNHTVHVWNGPPMVPVAAYSIPKPTALCCAAIRGDEIVISDTAGRLIVWLPPTVLKEVRNVFVSGMAVTPKGEVVVVGVAGLIRVYEADLVKWKDVGVHHGDGDVQVACLDDGLCVTGCSDGVSLWDIETSQIVLKVDCRCFSFAVGLMKRPCYFKPEILMCFSVQSGVQQAVITPSEDGTMPTETVGVRGLSRGHLTPAVQWSASDHDNLSLETLDDTTPTARSLGFLKANNLSPPKPCTDEAMRAYIIDFITSCKMSNQPYVDWWQLTPPPNPPPMSSVQEPVL